MVRRPRPGPSAAGSPPAAARQQARRAPCRGPAARPGTAQAAHGRRGGSPGWPGRRGRSSASGSPASACARSGIVSGTLAEQRDVELVGQRLAATLAEDREALAARRDEAGHVLDDSGDLEVDLVGHLGRAAGDLLGRRLGRGDDQELRVGQQLGERHRHVAGAGRQVDEQHVELAPGDVLEELRQRLVEHRPAPHDGAVLLDEEADRHDLHAVGLQRHDLALGRDRRALAARARTCAGSSSPRRRRRGRRPSCPRRPGGGEVGGQRRLADAALARADADDVGDLRQRAGGQPAAAELALQLALLGVGEHVEGDLDARDSLQRAHGLHARRSRSGCGSGSPAWSARRSTATVPSARASIERTMPSSTMSWRSSGSMTARRA